MPVGDKDISACEGYVDGDMRYLSSGSLAHEASSLSFRGTIGPETKPFDMCVREGAIVAGVTLDFADLNHGGIG